MLKILIIEDSEDDTLLLVHALKEGGLDFKYERVENRREMNDALKKEKWDAVISDYSLPRFSIQEALKLLRRMKLDIPFIVVSGVIGDEYIVELFKAGAHDFIRKDDLVRLVPALKRELKDAEIRHTQRQTVEKLWESEEKHRILFETMAQGVVYQDKDGKIISANPAAERILGLTLDQMQGRKSIDPRWRAIHEDGSDFPGDTHPAMIALKTGKEINNVKMGVFNPALEEFRWINISARLRFRSGEDAPIQVYTTFDDFTERKQMEQLIHTQAEVTRNMAEGAYIVGLNDVIIRWTSPKFEKMFGYESGEMIGKNASIVNAKDDLTPVEKADKIMEALHKTGEWHGEVKNIKKDGIQFWCYASVSTFTHQDYGEVLLAVHIDITKRKQAEEELKQKMKQLERFNKVAVNRELKMIELKKEINELLEKAGMEIKYSSPE